MFVPKLDRHTNKQNHRLVLLINTGGKFFQKLSKLNPMLHIKDNTLWLSGVYPKNAKMI